MFEGKKPKNWTESYWNQIERNIGFVKFSEQELLRKASIAVLGVGGLGGPLVEQLVRSGCEDIVICDNDRFEVSNLNRQVCTREDIGSLKVDAIERYLKKINLNAEIKKYYEITENNLSEILRGVGIVALTLDDPIISILISRECARKGIPMIESWAIPYICSWWFTSNSMDYETCYGLRTRGLSIKQIEESKKARLKVREAFLPKVLQFPGIKEMLDRESGALELMTSGKLALRSFAPVARMMASYLAFEIIFTGILGVKPMILAPKVIGFNYMGMKPFEFDF